MSTGRILLVPTTLRSLCFPFLSLSSKSRPRNKCEYKSIATTRICFSLMMLVVCTIGGIIPCTWLTLIQYGFTSHSKVVSFIYNKLLARKYERHRLFCRIYRALHLYFINSPCHWEHSNRWKVRRNAIPPGIICFDLSPLEC